MFRRLLSKDDSFFDMFEEHNACLIKACEALEQMTQTGANIEQCGAQILDLEHTCDLITRRCVNALRKTFITPFERGDIHDLISNMDEVVDHLEEVAAHIVMFDLKDIRFEVGEFARTLFGAAEEMGTALKSLRDLKNESIIQKSCSAIHRYEHDGDTILRSALKRLFSDEKDPIQVIKWKDIFEQLEGATDHCADVADIIMGVVIEAS